ncbi:MAG TPA: 50S ribosomal protein L25 [Chloroflexota bacterium]|nr:50S ribosomal protein L25 [Chloroflexota bacterium]
MADRIALEARTRTVLGKKVKQLRSQGAIPATVYGHNVPSESIEVDARAFRSVHATAGDNQLVDLVLDGQRPRPVLIHTTQIDPRRNTALHIEFYQANLREKLTARIPVHLTGESPATKNGLMLLTVLDGVDLECLPTDLPHFLEADVSGLEQVGDAIHVRDLKLDHSKCELKTDGDEMVAVVSAPQAAPEEEVAEVAEEQEAGAAAAEGESPSQPEG